MVAGGRVVVWRGENWRKARCRNRGWWIYEVKGEVERWESRGGSRGRRIIGKCRGNRVTRVEGVGEERMGGEE